MIFVNKKLHLQTWYLWIKITLTYMIFVNKKLHLHTWYLSQCGDKFTWNEKCRFWRDESIVLSFALDQEASCVKYSRGGQLPQNDFHKMCCRLICLLAFCWIECSSLDLSVCAWFCKSWIKYLSLVWVLENLSLICLLVFFFVKVESSTLSVFCTWFFL